MISRPERPAASPAAKTAARLSLGCAGSSDRYVSLKSRYRNRTPLQNAARAGSVLLAPPRYVAAGSDVTRRQMARATLGAFAPYAPNAHAKESISRRRTSCTVL